ncbi:MAG TPA: hypothetical protein VNP04_19525 [Alphaproteobacteria bacterium]|nr:hypothetical protein [Alphaproteobacteria bacterium]
MRRSVLAFLLFLILAGLRTYPLVRHLATHIPAEPIEPLLNTWILAWGTQALTTDPSQLFHANIFYPVERSLAFSEHLLGVQPIFAPVYLLSGNPLLAYNFLFLLAFALSGWAMFALVFAWTRAFGPSLVAGTLFTFAPGRLAQIGHIQLLNVFWTPLALLFVHRFLRERRWLDLLVFALFYWMQVLSSVYLGFMISIAVALYVGYYALVVDRTLLRLSLLPKALTFLIGSLLVLLPLHWPYFQVSEEWAISHAFETLIRSDAYVYLSAEPLNYLSVPTFIAEMYRQAIRVCCPLAEQVGINEKLLFPGMVLPVLVVLGSFGKVALIDSTCVRTLRRSFWLILLLAFMLSLGPFLVILGRQTELPLPYLLFFHVIPGFRVIRAPARFALLVVLAASPLAALGACKLCSMFQHWLPGKRLSAVVSLVVSAGLITLGLLELGLKPLPLARMPISDEIPEVYRWLAQERPGPIVEIPLGIFQEYEYLYYSTAHWLPLVNGVSGYIPSTYLEIKRALESLPSPKTVEYLMAIGVRSVVVHHDRLRDDERDRWQAATITHAGLEKVKAFGGDIVYRIPTQKRTSKLKIRMEPPVQLPAGREVKLGLSLYKEAGYAWTHPAPHETSASTTSTARIEWQNIRGIKSSTETKLALPFVMLPEEKVIVPVTVKTPQIPGTYTLRISVLSQDVEVAPETIEIRDMSLPTSLTAPHLLAATYNVPPGPSTYSVSSSDPIVLTLTAENTGQAAWLDTGDGDRGAIRLGWRWFAGGQVIASSEGRAPLRYTIFPGQSYVFQTSINPPEESGTYILEFGLVNEGIAWFSELGIPPIRLAVQVEHVSPCKYMDNLAALLAGGFSEYLHFRLFTDRALYSQGDQIHLFFKPDHFPKPFTSDVYLILHGEGCRLGFIDFDRPFTLYRGGLWPIFWRKLPLGQASDAPHFHMYSFPIVGLPPGRYTITILLTLPNHLHIIGHASTSFQIQS